MKKLYLLLGFLLCVTVLSVSAAPRTQNQMKEAAAKAINMKRRAMNLELRKASTMKTLKATAEYQIIGMEQGGFAVIAADDLVPEVLGVSTSKYSEGRNENFQWWLEAVGEAVRYVTANNIPMTTTKPDPAKYPTQIGPLMTTKWDQLEPYNRLCPISSGGDRCYTGCVATAMAQVLKYHEVPVCGIGTRTIYYPQYNPSGTPVTADFGEHVYDWQNMLDEYIPGEYNDEQVMAVAVLMRDCGVAADMEYGGMAEEGSGAYSQDAAAGLRTYFGIEDAECLERSNYSEAQWMDIVYRELSENGPLYYAGASYTSGGHAFVLHGYNEEGKVYVNWGWSGDDDGYYDIALLNPSYYTFNSQQNMIIGIQGTDKNLSDENITLTEAGTLSTQLGDDKIGTVGKLKITGNINSTDLRQIRRLSGVDEKGDQTDGCLKELDLSKARIVSGGDPYLTEGETLLTTTDDELPVKALSNCKKLRKVVLPTTLTAIGQEALSGCSGLREIRISSKEIPALNGTEVFKGVPVSTCLLYVPAGTKTKYLQLAQWKDFGNNVKEYGSSVKVRNTIRKYGEENPQFVYQVSGDPITGEPELTCEATKSSPAGKYPIVISIGTITDENVELFDGYMIVQKVGATATVENATREVGQPNPDFSLIFSGLVNDETVPVWVEEPVFSCEADIDSPAGEYPVTVTAKAESYNLTFVAGTLTVTDATGITTVKNDPKDNTAVYDLSGRRVENTIGHKGIYIRNGKKYIK